MSPSFFPSGVVWPFTHCYSVFSLRETAHKYGGKWQKAKKNMQNHSVDSQRGKNGWVKGCKLLYEGTHCGGKNTKHTTLFLLYQQHRQNRQKRDSASLIQKARIFTACTPLPNPPFFHKGKGRDTPFHFAVPPRSQFPPFIQKKTTAVTHPKKGWGGTKVRLSRVIGPGANSLVQRRTIGVVNNLMTLSQ